MTKLIVIMYIATALLSRKLVIKCNNNNIKYALMQLLEMLFQVTVQMEM